MDLRTDEILAAIRSKLGDEITVGADSSPIESKPEGHPLWWVEQTRYPAVFLNYKGTEFVMEPRQVLSRYRLEVYYAMDAADAGSLNPYSVCRQRTEVLLGRLEADRTLGLSYVQNSFPVAFLGENALAEFFRTQRQQRVACAFSYVVEIAQDQ